MKVLHVPHHFFPEPVGGTEVFVLHLCRELEALGVANTIAAPGASDGEYQYEGFPVLRYRVPPELEDVAELYGEGNVVAAEAFGRILDQVRSDLVHLHAYNRGVSLRTLQAAKARGLPVVFTLHLPGLICARGTLMLFGQQACDGVWDQRRCTACVLHSRGLPKAVAQTAAAVSAFLPSGWSGRLAPGRLGTVMRMGQLQRLRRRTVKTFLEQVDHCFALSRWGAEVLARNGTPRRKLSCSPHGIAGNPLPTAAGPAPELPETPIRLILLGRLHPTKGVHLVVEAFQQLPGKPLELDVFGLLQGPDSRQYLRKLQQSAAGDPRVRFLPALPPDQAAAAIRGYHALLVPSLSLETGPLVILEAFAAGTPVIGSNLGGIAELVRSGVDGILVEPSPARWRETLSRLCEKPQILRTLRAGVKPPRRMVEVAAEILAVYQRLLAKARDLEPSAANDRI